MAALGRAPAPFPSKGPTQANETKLSRDSLSTPVLSGGHPVLPPLPRGICQCLETGWVVTTREGGATGIYRVEARDAAEWKSPSPRPSERSRCKEQTLCQESQARIGAAAQRLWEISFSEPRCPRGAAGDRHRACFRATAPEAPRIAPNPFSKRQSSPLCWDFQPLLITDRCSCQTCHTRGRDGKRLVPLFPQQLY